MSGATARFITIILMWALLVVGTGCRPDDPVAGFSMDRTTGTVPLAVNFTDMSNLEKAPRITSWLWEFGDGQTSDVPNPSHTYTVAGSYAPRLTVTTNRGKTAVAAPSTRILAQPAAAATDITITLPGGVPLELVRIPAGSFLMGSTVDEQGGIDNERPRHSVTVDTDLYMGKYELTQAQWIAVMGTWPGLEPRAEWGMGADYPAYCVSWNDAQAFLAALNTHLTATGQGPATMRLPSEAEWEYACRAGSDTRFFFGDSLDCGDAAEDCAAGVLPGNRSDYLWYAGNNSPSIAKPVGTRLPNPFGLYDMAGNVSEWMEDDWHFGYSGAPATRAAWTTLPRGPYRLTRGGTYHYDARYCRSATRFTGEVDARYENNGFRVVRDL